MPILHAFLLFTDSYRSFYPDHTCYRYRRSAAVSDPKSPEQIFSKSAEISRNHFAAEKSKKHVKEETKETMKKGRKSIPKVKKPSNKTKH